MFDSIWYNSLLRPGLNPPDWLFAPAWSILYLTMVISFILFSSSENYYNKDEGYAFFGLQLLLNFLWSPVFFFAQNIGAALVVLIFLNMFIMLTIGEFYKVSKPSALILTPYALWSLFAIYLNIGYLILN